MTMAIRKCKAGHPANVHNILTCDSNDPKCMKRICSDCNPRNIFSSWNANSSSSSGESDSESNNDDETDEKTYFSMWIRENKKMKKVAINFPQVEFYNQWEKW